MLRMYQRVLGKEGYEVVCAADGILGVEAYRAAPDFAKVITDMGMPNATGLYVIEEIRKLNPEQKIYLAASCDKEHLERAQALGIDGFLRKAFDHVDLIKLIRGELISEE